MLRMITIAVFLSLLGSVAYAENEILYRDTVRSTTLTPSTTSWGVTPEGDRLIETRITDEGKIHDSIYGSMGHIDEDGYVYDICESIGRVVDKDGVYEVSYIWGVVAGNLLPNGDLVVNGGRLVGHLAKDGELTSVDGKLLAKFDGIPAKWVAVYFFFASDWFDEESVGDGK